MSKWDDIEMVRTVVDLGQFLGMPIRPSPMLDLGEWCFDHSGIVVAHDIWTILEIPVFDPEMILPDEEVFDPDEHGAD